MQKWNVKFTYTEKSGKRRTKERTVFAKGYAAAVESVKERWQPIFGKIQIVMWEEIEN